MNVEMKSMKYILFLTEFKYSDNRTNIFQAKLLKYTTDFLDKIISIEAILWLHQVAFSPRPLIPHYSQSCLLFTVILR
jgi:hypothetical protein